nr:hypothetical protein [Actinomycetota bacterium]
VKARVGVAALAGSLGVAGCGGEEDFANDPRPAAPIVVTAKVDPKQVVLSPDEFGAGLVNITVSNQSEDPVRLTLVGPGPEDNAESGEIPPNGVGNVKAALDEGDYEVNGGERSDAKPAQLTVGPPRSSSSDELLLP